MQNRIDDITQKTSRMWQYKGKTNLDQIRTKTILSATPNEGFSPACGDEELNFYQNPHYASFIIFKCIYV